MSERSAGVAYQEVLDTADDAEIAQASFGLLEAIGFDYERYCRVFDVDPERDETRAVWQALLDTYAKTWQEVGQAIFERMVRDQREKWSRILVDEPRIRRFR